MVRIRQALVAGIVWATSASTLMAALPFSVCLCPGGKAGAVASAPTPSSCDGSACCRSTGGVKTCCRQKAANHTAQYHATGLRHAGSTFVEANCRQILVQVETPGLDGQGQTTNPPSLDVGQFAWTATGLTQVPLLIPHLKTWRHDRLPPPTDLLTSLQRLIV